MLFTKENDETLPKVTKMREMECFNENKNRSNKKGSRKT